MKTGGSKEGKKGEKERRLERYLLCATNQHDAVFKAAKGVSIS